MQAELWSLNGLAVELGRDRRSLARDLDSLEPDKTERRGSKIDRRWRMKRVIEHLYRNHSVVDPGAEQFDGDQRQRLAAAQAEKHEMENAVRRGQLADVAKVQAAWAEHIAAARAKLLSMPPKLGPQLTNVADPNIISTRIRVEVNAAINELAEWELPEADGGDRGGDQADGDDLAQPAGVNGQPVGRRTKKAQ